MKMKAFILIQLIVLLGTVTGCQKDLPKPKTKPKNVSIVKINGIPEKSFDHKRM